MWCSPYWGQQLCIFFFCKSRRRLRNKRSQLPRVRTESWILEKVWKIEIRSGKMVKSLPWATLFSLNFACIKFCEKSWAIFRDFSGKGIIGVYQISRFFYFLIYLWRQYSDNRINNLIVNNSKDEKRWNKTDGRFDDCISGILKNLAAEDSSNSQIDAAEGWWTKSNKKLLNLKLRHVGILLITNKEKAWFRYFMD